MGARDPPRSCWRSAPRMTSYTLSAMSQISQSTRVLYLRAHYAQDSVLRVHTVGHICKTRRGDLLAVSLGDEEDTPDGEFDVIESPDADANRCVSSQNQPSLVFRDTRLNCGRHEQLLLLRADSPRRKTLPSERADYEVRIGSRGHLTPSCRTRMFSPTPITCSGESSDRNPTPPPERPSSAQSAWVSSLCYFQG